MEVVIASVAILLYTFTFAAAATDGQRQKKRVKPSSPAEEAATVKQKRKHRSSQSAEGTSNKGTARVEAVLEVQPEKTDRRGGCRTATKGVSTGATELIGPSRECEAVYEYFSGAWICPACKRKMSHPEDEVRPVVATECSDPGCRFIHPEGWNITAASELPTIKAGDMLCPICGCHKVPHEVSCPRCGTLSTNDDAKRKEWRVLWPKESAYVHEGHTEVIDLVRKRTNIELKKACELDVILTICTDRRSFDAVTRDCKSETIKRVKKTVKWLYKVKPYHAY